MLPSLGALGWRSAQPRVADAVAVEEPEERRDDEEDELVQRARERCKGERGGGAERARNASIAGEKRGGSRDPGQRPHGHPLTALS